MRADEPELPPDLVGRVLPALRPVVYAGAGALGAAGGVRALVERWPAPVLTTPSARGLVPEDHPNVLPFDPVAGGLEVVNELLDAADLVLALGCKLSHAGSAGFRLRLDPEALVHVNTDADALGANYPSAFPVHGRVEPVVDTLLEALDREEGRSAWSADEIASWRERLRTDRPADALEPVIRGVPDGDPGSFFAALREAVPRDGVLVTDSGLHGVLARRHLEVRAPGGLLGPTDFASMGFGLPAAIGAALAAPDRPVAALVGDGGFAISAMELLTAVRQKLGLPVLVFNDGHLNLIRLQQIRGYGRTHAVDVQEPDLECLADALGARYRRWEEEGGAAVREAFGRDRPTVIEVVLGDSAGIRARRVRGAVRATVRDLLGPERIARLRSLFGGG